MVARPTWSGQLRISLVSFPVRLYPASTSGPEVPLHQIHKPTGKRVRYQLTVADVGEVSREDIIKGYEYKRGKYVTFEPEELENIHMEAKHTLDMTQFVKAEEIDAMYFDKPYFVVPENAQASEAFAVVRKALEDENKVGLGEIVFSGKEHLAMIRPSGKGMILETLRYPEEVRKADSYFEDISAVDIDEDQLSLAKELITRKTSAFDPHKFHDHYVEAIKKLIEAKAGGKALPDEEEERPSNVVNLMDALKKSVAEADRTETRARPKTASKGKTKEPARKSKAG